MENNNSSEEMLQTGLFLVGYKDGMSQNNMTLRRTRFKAHYGVGPQTAIAIWNDLVRNNVGPKELDPAHFLMTMLWFKSYDVDSKLVSHMQVNEKTIRGYYLTYAAAIQSMKRHKIVWRWNGNFHDDETIFIGTVDGVYFRIEEPRTDPDALWFSHKFHAPGVGYEVCLDIFENKLMWVNGPFPAGDHDLTMFRCDGGLKEKLPIGKKLIADRGYSNEPQISTPNDLDGDDLKQFKRRARARHENFNRRLKEYRILSDRFRHDLGKHKMVFEALCVVVQYDFENERPLFNV